MPTGLSAAFAGCEALRAEQTADGNTQRVVAGAKCSATTPRLTGRQAAGLNVRVQPLVGLFLFMIIDYKFYSCYCR